MRLYFRIGAVVCLAAFTASGQLPTNVIAGTITVRATPVANAATPILDMAIRPGETERFFVAGKNGTIRVLQNGAFLAQPYLDISTGFGLESTGERGLLGLAIHPDFGSAGAAGFGKFYTYTSEAKGTNAAHFFTSTNGPNGGSHHNVVREWSVDPAATSIANPATASRVLFRSANPFDNHNGGALKFGPDKLLYISLGDGGTSSPLSQDTSLVLGKILRINPTATNPPNGRYGIPTDNPFAAPGNPGLDEIYAYGLRNPFRMQFDRATGNLYAGDVGEGGPEEVDKIESGGNYGWPYYEGTILRSNPPPGLSLIAPLAQYSHSFGRSVIGGFVYNGSAIQELRGKYVFGDAYNATLRYMDISGGQVYSLLIAPGSPTVPGSLYGWGEGPDGELYGLHGFGQMIRIDSVPEPFSAFGIGIMTLLCRTRPRQTRSQATAARSF